MTNREIRKQTKGHGTYHWEVLSGPDTGLQFQGYQVIDRYSGQPLVRDHAQGMYYTRNICIRQGKVDMTANMTDTFDTQNKKL